MKLRVVIALAAVSTIGLYLLYSEEFISIYWIFVPMVIAKAIIAWGVVNIRSNFFIKSFNGKSATKELVLSFDDGPTENTLQILDVLSRLNITALFFVIGQRVKKNKTILEEIHNRGHWIGNHSFSHSNWFDLYGTIRVQNELKETNKLIHNITGKQPQLFRPPYGVTNPKIARAVKNLGLTVIGWNVRTKDTVNTNEAAFIDKVLKKAEKGGIVLLHDDRSFTVKVLEKLVLTLQEHGYTIVHPQKMIETQPYA